MIKPGTEPAPGASAGARWTLIRGACQVVTLHGASGPRCGAAMSDLNIISDGAVLIRDGIIEEVGTTRRIENLAAAGQAREIDATGRIVMPAFVDPDIALASPASCAGRAGQTCEPDIRRISARRLLGEASSLAADLTAFGVLTVGAHTLSAPDLQNTCKALRLHQVLQSRPLRIRSIFSPVATSQTGMADLSHISQIWIPAILRKKLASLMEIPVSSETTEDARNLAAAGAASGYSIRMRFLGPTTSRMLELARSSGAISVTGTVAVRNDISRSVTDPGCVNVILASGILAGAYASRREAIDYGTPFALASGYRSAGEACANPQYLLYLASRALGMTIEEAIVAATYNAACALRLSHVTGSLAPGKSADICVMNVGDYHELGRRVGHHDVSLAMRAGKVVYRRQNPTME